MNLLRVLQKINPEFSEFITQDIRNSKGEIVGTKCVGLEKNSHVFSGGTAAKKDTAIRIAIAEAFERSYLDVIASHRELSQEFELTLYPSSSGFAAGFDQKSTRFRAICEGLERWVWSKWIDENFIIPTEKKPCYLLSPLAQHLIESFDEVLWFKKEFCIEISASEKLNLSIVIFLGIFENGIYPGSRVSTTTDDLYQHPIIEAHRNLSNALLDRKNPRPALDIIQERTLFFASHKDLALAQVNKAAKTNWPAPELLLLIELPTESDEVFIFRCLFKDFIGWHTGEVSRFVY